MLTFIGILLVTQLLFTLVVGHKLLKIPLWAVLVATNANVGGPAALLRAGFSRGWPSNFTSSDDGHFRLLGGDTDWHVRWKNVSFVRLGFRRKEKFD